MRLTNLPAFPFSPGTPFNDCNQSKSDQFYLSAFKIDIKLKKSIVHYFLKLPKPAKTLHLNRIQACHMYMKLLTQPPC